MTQHAGSRRRDPLIWATKQGVFAVDPNSGALRWRVNTSMIQRMFRLGKRLFLLTTDGLSSLDASSGKACGQIELDFIPNTGLVTPERLFVAGPGGAAALGPSGAVLWSINQEPGRGDSQRQFYACQGSDGFPLWREEIDEVNAADRPGLVFGEQVAQPKPSPG